MGYEIVYKGRDNTNDFILKSDGVAVDLSGVTKMELVFGEPPTVSSESSPDVFDWSAGGGKLVLSMGGLDTLVAGGRYEPTLIVYDADNASGINWGAIQMYVK